MESRLPAAPNCRGDLFCRPDGIQRHQRVHRARQPPRAARASASSGMPDRSKASKIRIRWKSPIRWRPSGSGTSSPASTRSRTCQRSSLPARRAPRPSPSPRIRPYGHHTVGAPAEPRASVTAQVGTVVRCLTRAQSERALSVNPTGSPTRSVMSLAWCLCFRRVSSVSTESRCSCSSRTSYRLGLGR